MAKDITIGGRDYGRTGSDGGGGKSGGGSERKDGGGGYPSGSTGYGGDHGGRDSTRGYGSYSEHFDNGTPVTRYGRKLVASEAAFEKAKFASSFAAHYVSKTPAYTAQEMVGWLEHTNNTQNLKFNLPYKEINLSGKSVTNEDMVFFASRMKNFAFHLDSLQLNHNPISDYGIQALFNCVFTVPLGRSVVHLKLNNCNFGDVGAELIAAYVRDGYMPARSIDVSGNKITEVGQGCFSRALESPKIKDVVVTLEVHNSKGGVINFIKKAANYIFEEHSKALAVSKAAEIALYGDFAYCKKVLKDTSFDVATGLIKESLNPIQKLKVTKKVATVGIFAMVAKEGVGSFVSEDLARCVAFMNAKLYVTQDAEDYTSALGVDSIFDQ